MLVLGRFGLGFWYGALNAIIRLEVNALAKQIVHHLRDSCSEGNPSLKKSDPSFAQLTETQMFQQIIGGLQSFFAIFVCVSMAISPYIGGILDTNISFHSAPLVQFNIFTWPGWILSFCGIICAIGTITIKNTSSDTNREESAVPKTHGSFERTPLLTEEPNPTSTNEESDDLQDGRSVESPPSFYSPPKVKEPSSGIIPWENNGRPNWIVWNTILAFFISSLGYTAIETMATPYMQDQLAIEVDKTSIVFLIGGIANVIVFTLIVLLPKELTDLRLQIVFSSVLCVVGCLFLVNWKGLIHAPFAKDDPCQMFTCAFDTGINNYPCANVTESNDMCANKNCLAIGAECETCLDICLKPALTLSYVFVIIGFAVINVGFPPGRVGSGAYYSVLLGAKKQGFMQGLLVSSGSIARILAPLIVNGVYTATDHQPWSSSLVLAVIFAIPFFCWAIPYKLLQLS
jgi:hypothetical protein